MITPEEAERRLETLRDPDWRAAAMERAAALPDDQRAIVGTVLENRPENYDPDFDYDAFDARKTEAGRSLDGLAHGERAAVMDALHPGLGPALTRWWTDARTRPYQPGWSRKSFRVSAAHPEVTVVGRAVDLRALLDLAGPFDADPVWLVIWGGHLLTTGDGRYTGPGTVGGLLASAIDLGGDPGDRVFGTLLEIGNGEHPTGMMGRHVIHALLCSSRRDGWEFTGRLLLAAQRQEGLRQVILEAADEGHPDAFGYLLQIVLDHDLLRFAAAVRAAGVWLGLGADVSELPKVAGRVRKLAGFHGSATERALALRGDDPADIYTALCAAGMHDVMATLEDLRRLAAHPSADLRAVALRYSAAIDLPVGEDVLAAALGDPDVSVASLAETLLPVQALTRRPGMFEVLTRLIERLPVKRTDVPVRPTTGTSIGVEQTPVILDRSYLARRLVDALGDRPVADLLPWLEIMDTAGRAAAAYLIADSGTLAPDLRAALFTLLGDRAAHVRDTALRAVKKLTVTPDEAPGVEALLTRAAADIRRGALTLLAAQPPDAARASAERLAASKNKRQREAAAELRRETGAGPGEIEDLRVTLPGPRTEPLTPRPAASGRRFADEAARRIVEAIDEIAHAHRDVPVTVASWQGTEEVLLADADARFFPGPFFSRAVSSSAVSSRAAAGGSGGAPDMLLGEVFRTWWAGRPDAMRGGDDGLDALHACVLSILKHPGRRDPRYWGGWWNNAMVGLAAEPPEEIRHAAIVGHVVAWLLAEHVRGAVVDECLDAFEASLAVIPAARLIPPPLPDGWRRHPTSRSDSLPGGDWRNLLYINPWHTVLDRLWRGRPDLFTAERLARRYRLARWVERPHPDAVPLIGDHLLAAAHRAGVATDGDVIDAFLTPGNDLFRRLTGRWRHQAGTGHPTLVPLADRVRERVLEVELRRGDLPTPTSGVAGTIGSVAGAETTAALLAALGDTPLARGWNWGASAESRDAVFSHLIRVSFPDTQETGETLRDAAARAGVPGPRLVDLALYAPQWAGAVEEALGWRGLADGVLWLHAHTKDTRWAVAQELRDSWAAMIAERTPLSSADLMEGAVDVDWFRRSHGELGQQRWSVLYKAARYAAGGNGHRRARLFAEAMLAEASEPGLAERITGKRDQDAVRALGLLPLPDGPDERREAAARRYALLREFERGGRQFGSQRRASEAAAVRIGIDNLARTAGYPDPRRFIWAAEAAEAGDLARGPVTATAGEVEVTLSVTGEGVPALEARRGSRALKAVPAAAKKDPAVAALAARKTALARQVTRVRDTLQDAMTAQEGFTVADFEALARHPVVAPVLGRLVWVTADGVTLMRPQLAELASMAFDGPLRVAHPGDMVADGTWVHWQERLFKKELRQPFKQVFRELYTLTPAEKAAGPSSRRYDGHQVQPRQALALLGGRGWITSQETGDAARAFHRHGYIARVTFDDGLFTAAEGDLPTITGVHFTRPGDWAAQPLESVPPIVFSEAMRDLDLVVSVAHAGGVDPEATASTTAMRQALVRETARLLKLGNVRFSGTHVLIDGKLGEYSVHLGSAVVHRRPGGSLCIIPVGSQRRGRLFLPFADDDPKTAEVVSKVLLLARDHEIKDPTILEQLGG